MDKLIGRAVAKLDALELRDNTIITFVGDNGTCGGHPPVVVDGKPFPSGGKGSLKDLGTRVPLIVNWRGLTRGRVSEDMVDITDFYATLADIAGTELTPADAIDGVSFLPQVKGEQGNPREWVFVLFDRNDTVLWRSCVRNNRIPKPEQRQGGFWARTARWKLYGDGNLYDMEADPFEQSPLTAKSDDRKRAAIRTRLEGVFVELAISQEDLITFDEYRQSFEDGRNPR
jgi:arylsulfatase A